MQGKVLVAFFTIFLEATFAQKCCNSFLNIPEYGRPYPILDDLYYGYPRPQYYNEFINQNYVYSIPNYYEGQILPPMPDYGFIIPSYEVFPQLGCIPNEGKRVPLDSKLYDGYIVPPVEMCGCMKQKCCKELILPPMRLELPRDLGYLASAVPLAASYYQPAVEVCGECAGASVPVTSPCSCLALAAPVCPDIAQLVRPVIL